MPQRGNLTAEQLNGYPDDDTLFLAGKVNTDGSNKWLAPSGGGGGGGSSGFTAPPLTGWSWDNQGTATEDTGSGASIYLDLPQTSSTMRVRYRTAPSTPYTITAAFYFNMVSSDNALDFGFGDGSGKYVMWHMATNGNVYVLKWNSTTSPSTAYAFQTTPFTTAGPQPIWLQISDDGTNVIFRWRLSAVDKFQVFTTQLRGNFLSSPTRLAWGGYVNGGLSQQSMVSWLQT